MKRFDDDTTNPRRDRKRDRDDYRSERQQARRAKRAARGEWVGKRVERARQF